MAWSRTQLLYCNASVASLTLAMLRNLFHLKDRKLVWVRPRTWPIIWDFLKKSGGAEIEFQVTVDICKVRKNQHVDSCKWSNNLRSDKMFCAAWTILSSCVSWQLPIASELIGRLNNWSVDCCLFAFACFDLTIDSIVVDQMNSESQCYSTIYVNDKMPRNLLLYKPSSQGGQITGM